MNNPGQQKLLTFFSVASFFPNASCFLKCLHGLALSNKMTTSPRFGPTMLNFSWVTPEDCYPQAGARSDQT